MHNSGAYKLLNPLGFWFLLMCRRRCECGFAEGGEGKRNIRGISPHELGVDVTGAAGCQWHKKPPPAPVSQSLSPTDLLLNQELIKLIKLIYWWLMPMGHAHNIRFVLLWVFSSLWLFRRKKQIDCSGLDFIGHSCCDPDWIQLLWGQWSCRDRRKIPQDSAESELPGTEREMLQGRWWFLQGRVKFCSDTIVCNGYLWMF